MDSNPDFFKPFTLVIATQVRHWSSISIHSGYMCFSIAMLEPELRRQVALPPPPPLLQLREADALAIDAICRQHGVPLLLLRSYGLCGYVRPSVPELRVIESKPDSKVDDLRWVTGLLTVFGCVTLMVVLLRCVGGGASVAVWHKSVQRRQWLLHGPCLAAQPFQLQAEQPMAGAGRLCGCTGPGFS
jgi:hypothetical protein